jgi:hypothetical protein
LAILTDHRVDDEDSSEDDQREWEECMDRRRMMFAMRSCGDGEVARGNGGEGRCPEFEGYRSISASLAEMLRSVGIGGPGCATPPIMEEDEEEEAAERVDERASIPNGREGVFEALRRTDTRKDGIDTPSLLSSAGSDVESCTLRSPNTARIHEGPAVEEQLVSAEKIGYIGESNEMAI